MARISEYDYNLCIEICDKIADGKHVVDVLKSDDRFPVWSTFRVWKREHVELQTLYTSSIQDKAEMLTYEINQTMQDLKDGNIDAPAARVIIDTLKWFASKFYPKMYGDKLDVTSGDKPIETNTVAISIDGIALQASNIKVKEPESNNP